MLQGKQSACKGASVAGCARQLLAQVLLATFAALTVHVHVFVIGCCNSIAVYSGWGQQVLILAGASRWGKVGAWARFPG